MYKIIGADKKEYGPITSAQLRHWISEGRVNAQTLARAEGTQEWIPLSAFAEFTGELGTEASATPPAPAAFKTGGDREAALRAVKAPAIALKVTAIVGLVVVALGLAMNILALAGIHFGMQQVSDPQMQKMFDSLVGSLGIVQDIIGAVVGVVMLKGASKMQLLQNHQFAFVTSILAMVPCVSPCCLFGLPFGIWALVVLNRPEVKSQFT